MNGCVRCESLVKKQDEWMESDLRIRRELSERVSQLEKALEDIANMPVTRTWREWENKLRAARAALDTRQDEQVTAGGSTSRKRGLGASETSTLGPPYSTASKADDFTQLMRILPDLELAVSGLKYEGYYAAAERIEAFLSQKGGSDGMVAETHAVVTDSGNAAAQTEVTQADPFVPAPREMKEAAQRALRGTEVTRSDSCPCPTDWHKGEPRACYRAESKPSANPLGVEVRCGECGKVSEFDGRCPHLAVTTQPAFQGSKEDG